MDTIATPGTTSIAICSGRNNNWCDHLEDSGRQTKKRGWHLHLIHVSFMCVLADVWDLTSKFCKFVESTSSLDVKNFRHVLLSATLLRIFSTVILQFKRSVQTPSLWCKTCIGRWSGFDQGSMQNNAVQLINILLSSQLCTICITSTGAHMISGLTQLCACILLSLRFCSWY